jgi:hypothetical protein
LPRDADHSVYLTQKEGREPRPFQRVWSVHEQEGYSRHLANIRFSGLDASWNRDRECAMASLNDERTTEFQRGWDAALLAARAWHEAKAKQAMVLSRRTRFPKNLEREAEVHKQCAEMIQTLSPDDV